jgi:hypothetical protein
MAMAKRGDAAEVHKQVLELGGRVIYNWRRTRKVPWEQAADETRSAYRARMQELLNALAVAGYEVRR